MTAVHSYWYLDTHMLSPTSTVSQSAGNDYTTCTRTCDCKTTNVVGG